MKVALLVRGEPRYYKEGYALLRHLLFDRFPDIDFRIFSAISPTITNDKANKTTNSSNDNYSDHHPVYSTVQIDSTVIDDIVKTYAPARFQIVNNKRIIDAMDLILENYYEKILSENKGITRFTDSISRIDLICKWFYFFSQHINYLESRQCLIKYSVENNWIPDIIITTRIDLFFKFDLDFFKKWEICFSEHKKRFSFDLDDEHNAGFIFPSAMVTKDHTVWVDDFIFIEFYNKKMYEYHNRSVTDIFLDYLAHNTSWTKYMFDGNSSHYMWSTIFSDMLMCSYPPINELNYFAGILRPCSDFELVKEIINTGIHEDEKLNHLMFNLAESQKHWKNGSNGKRPSNEVVLDTFKLLSMT